MGGSWRNTKESSFRTSHKSPAVRTWIGFNGWPSCCKAGTVTARNAAVAKAVFYWSTLENEALCSALSLDDFDIAFNLKENSGRDSLSAAKVFSSAELVRLLAIFNLTPRDFRLRSCWNKSRPWGGQRFAQVLSNDVWAQMFLHLSSKVSTYISAGQT